MTAYNFTEAVKKITDGIATSEAGRESVERGWGLMLTGIASDRAAKVTVASIATKIKKANTSGKDITDLPTSGSSVSNYEVAGIVWSLPGDATVEGRKVVARLEAPGKAHGCDTSAEFSLPSYIRSLLKRDDCSKEDLARAVASAKTKQAAMAALLVKETSLKEKAELARAAAAAKAEEAAKAETPEEAGEAKAKKEQTKASLVKASQGALSRAAKGEDKEGKALEVGEDLAGELKKVMDFVAEIAKANGITLA